MSSEPQFAVAVRTALAARTSAGVVEALNSVDPEDLRRYLHADLTDTASARVLTVGVQLTYAFSRDDVAARLLPAYQAAGILDDSPFRVLDTDGIGRLVTMACEAAGATKPSIGLGACGEHAGHPASIGFLVEQGLDSVSCSPFRVPATRLAVAQSLLAARRVDADELTFSFESAVDDSEVEIERAETSMSGGAGRAEEGGS